MIIIFISGNISVLKGQADSASTNKEVEDIGMTQYKELLNSDMNKMLELWYVKREVANSRSVLSKLSDETIVDDGNMDSIYRQRLSKIPSVVQLGYNATVKNYINLYANKRKRSSSALLGLAQYYYPWMIEIFDKYGVPEELVYITIVESSLNPFAVSPAGATGIWQFMYTTGKMYGLEVNSFIDDRRDPVKATDAAARHLRDLYNMFNDWGLAISAYNCGAGNVRKAIYRSGGKQNFWEIRQYLPRETQNYFPAYIGAYYMMKYHSIHGITPTKITIPSNVDTVMVKKEVHFEQIAHVLDISLEEIKTLNPQYKRSVIPAFDEPYPLKLRSNDVLRFIAMQDSIYKYEYDTYFAPLQMYVNAFTGKTVGDNSTTKKKYHTVRSGETLSKIANKYGLSLEELKKMNKLKSNYIKTGQKLLVGYTYTQPPASSQPAADKAAENKDTNAHADKSSQVTKPATSTETEAAYTIHTVAKGETLCQIATKYHTTVQKIAQINHLTNVNSLKVGQKLKIPR